MKRLAAAAVLAVTATALTACGGGSSAPADAKESDFCNAYVALFDKTSDVDPDDYDAQAKAMQEWGDGLAEVGTPEGISDDARKGFEKAVDLIQDIDAKDIEKATEDAGDSAADPFSSLEMSEEEEKQSEELGTYVQETCATQIEEAMTKLMQDAAEGMGDEMDKALEDSDVDLSELEKQLEELEGQE
ncbi:MAG: hypothetical protein ACI379_10940 [Nocardioides sp.]|uniref:hypothetical protein n=1 Tax=Nocardioides sp. TaxID=35761 RepID=UPI003F0BA184